MPKQKGRSTHTRHIGAFGLKSANFVLFSTDTLDHVTTDEDGLTATSTRTVTIEPVARSAAATITATTMRLDEPDCDAR